MLVTKGQCAKMPSLKKIKFNMAEKYTVSGALEELDNFDFDLADGCFLRRRSPLLPSWAWLERF